MTATGRPVSNYVTDAGDQRIVKKPGFPGFFVSARWWQQGKLICQDCLQRGVLCFSAACWPLVYRRVSVIVAPLLLPRFCHRRALSDLLIMTLHLLRKKYG
jgi:hypothetical protein